MTDDRSGTANSPDAATLEALIEGDEDRVLTFEAPWQARAFGIALALRDRGTVDWSDFQARFIETVQATDPDRMQADVEAVYYECWLETLEAVVLDVGGVGAGDIDRRTAEFAAGIRDSGEFESE